MSKCLFDEEVTVRGLPWCVAEARDRIREAILSKLPGEDEPKDDEAA